MADAVTLGLNRYFLHALFAAATIYSAEWWLLTGPGALGSSRATTVAVALACGGILVVAALLWKGGGRRSRVFDLGVLVLWAVLLLDRPLRTAETLPTRLLTVVDMLLVAAVLASVLLRRRFQTGGGL